eukprot:COSAG01_NODE_12343_length_1756_cov_1.546771_2_plen_306_part_00
MGIMPSYASYNPRNQDVVQDAVVICLANSFFSLVAGLAVFSILGYMAEVQKTCVSEVAQGGPGLAFVVFPTALAMMPGAVIWSLMFFAMLLALGIDSAFSMVESFNTALSDFVTIRKLAQNNGDGADSGDAFEVEIKQDTALIKEAAQQAMRTRVTPLVCIVGWLLGIIFCTQSGLYWLDVFNKYVVFTLTLVGCVECVAATWVRDALAPANHPTLATEISAMVSVSIGRQAHTFCCCYRRQMATAVPFAHTHVAGLHCWCHGLWSIDRPSDSPSVGYHVEIRVSAELGRTVDLRHVQRVRQPRR